MSLNKAEIGERLRERFAQAIRKSYSPCPLIGPKWLREFPNGKPADFQFIGIGKLAKALAVDEKVVLRKVAQAMDAKDLPVEFEMTADGKINVHINGPAESTE